MDIPATNITPYPSSTPPAQTEAEQSEIVSVNPEANGVIGKKNRLQLIEKLEKERGSKILSYITGTRTNLDFPIAIDSIRKMFEHLKSASEKEEGGKIKKLDLFLHSNGGDGIVPWKLVTLIRDYAETFSVIVPHRAFSAATLISLGADEILMHPMGMLGPVDPTVKNEFNPPNPQNPNALLGISVEDVTAYIKLVKEDFGIHHEDELIQAINILASQVHPLALGNVKRFHSQSRMLAKKLLQLHMTGLEDEHKIDEIVDNLNSKLYFHGHPIHYKEAQKLGLKATLADKNQQDLIWSLYLAYEDAMKLDEEFRPVDDFVKERPGINVGQVDIIDLPTVNGVYIESLSRTDKYTIDFQVWGTRDQRAVINTQLLTRRQGWQTE